MVAISYSSVMVGISLVYFLTRVLCCIRAKGLNWKKEFRHLLVYICIIVVVRFTFFPFSKVDGKVQPLLFDPGNAFPFRINLLPIVYLLDYPVFREAMINLIGNTAMFIPLGIVWPIAFEKLNTYKKVIGAGIGFSLCIEILQLPFFDRVSDIDDLLLNALGFLMGYGIYLLVRRIGKRRA